MPRPRVLAAVLLAFVPWLGGCAPKLAPPGPAEAAPGLSEGAPAGVAAEESDSASGAELMTFVTRDGYDLLFRDVLFTYAPKQ